MRIIARVEKANNQGYGCMGMCKEPFGYKFEVQKMIPRTQQYATVHQVHEKYLFDAKIPEIVMTLPELCNTNEKAPIRFALTDYKARIFNVFQTTVQ